MIDCTSQQRFGPALLRYVLFCAVLHWNDVLADVETKPAFEFGIEKHSKYVSQARDNLDSGGLISVQAAMNWQPLSTSIWFGDSDSGSYQELNFGITHDFELGVANVSLGYTRLIFLDTGEADNEFSLSVSADRDFWIVPRVDYTYSTQAAAGVVELFLSSEFDLGSESISVEPYLMQGFDFGFAGQENYSQAGVNANWTLSEVASVFASANRSWLANPKGHALPTGQTWITVGLSAEF
ncbi:hypothetical protein GCM10008090_02640 [Arenicella chitinivorans]|uniref:Uncharacterized protein n=1 Tax=Arenicella chitinivorans TaxID=1329800 RepID=A0A918RI28_9GAMM|nr:hypothetical protein [Arenicella chitinivorans]GGZ97787.1 hypothetical protein GCM10008090_02640 [Arenicella chitinivorans]